MPDIFDKAVRFHQDPRIVKAEDKETTAGVLYRLSPLNNAGPRIKVGGRQILQFSTNDYLGLANNWRVKRAACKIVDKVGVGAPMGARPLTGDIQLHRQLQKNLAAFKRTEASLVFSSGAFAMMGTVSALANSRDLIIMDRYAHASLVCGAKISGARMRFFKHNDLEYLEAILLETPPEQAKMVIVDGVYSMQGDMAPLPGICDLCEKYGARLIVDDAHGTGVCGENGRGTAEHFDVEDRIDLHLGTFSKALGTTGGFVAGDQTIIDFLKYTAPTILFTKAIPACIASATNEALKLVIKAKNRRKKAWSNAHRLQDGLRKMGLDVGTTQSPITPIKGNRTGAVHLGKALYEDYDIWAGVALYPAVPMGQSILRIITTSNHNKKDIDIFLEAMKELKEKHPDAMASSSTRAR